MSTTQPHDPHRMGAADATADDAEVIRKARRGRGAHMGPHGGGMVAEKAMSFGPSLKRLLGELRPVRALAWGTVLCTVAAVLLATLGPLVLGTATDLIFAGVIGGHLPAGATKDQLVAKLRGEGNTVLADLLSGINLTPGVGIDFAAVAQVILVACGLYVVSSVFTWVAGRLVAAMVARTMQRLRSDVENKIHRLPLPYVDGQPRGELLSRVTNDLDNVGQSLQQTFGQLLNSLVSVVCILGMMLWVSPLLTLVTVLAIPVSMLIMGLVMKRSQKLFVEQWKQTGILNGLVEEAMTGHELVTVFGRRAEVEARFATANGALREVSRGAMFISGITMPAMMFVSNVSYVVVAVVGALRVASGQITLGSVQAFIQYSRQFSQPLSQVAAMMNLVQSGVASAERVFDVLDAREETDVFDSRGETPAVASPTASEKGAGTVRFENVSFRYTPDVPLLDHVSLVAEPGHTVAIVGPTGAGKTTLVNLIMRFYDVDAGRITIDGVDIREMSRHQLRSRVGMVLQDTWLFEGTIRDNIAYGNEHATEEQIVEAARAAYVDRFVQHLPEGYHTVLDDEGTNVSAGQKQLITIARAFLSQPSLLILDEATSSVDTRTEVEVQHAMERLRSDRTSFVIAHRLSTIRDADTIVVMEEGRIVEQGSHDELLAARGAYARLYQAQFSGLET